MENKKSFVKLIFDDGTIIVGEDQVGIVVNEFHGDYDFDWLVIREGDRELQRWNPRYV